VEPLESWLLHSRDRTSVEVRSRIDDQWHQEQSHRHSCRAPLAVHHTRESEKQRDWDDRRRAHATDPPTSNSPAPFTDLGPRPRTVEPQSVYGCDQRVGVLLRPSKSMAAWIEREHERLAAPVLSEKDGSVCLYPSRSRPSGDAFESTTA